MLTVGVDVGGTNIQIGLVDDDHHVVGRAKVATPTEGPEAVIAAIVTARGGGPGSEPRRLG